jgi:3',5'-cyclic AMP phosphodiesterase CpdA
MVDDRGPRRVVQISDTHLSQRRAYGVLNVLAALRCLAADPPDLVVHTGDVVADDPDDEEERAFAAGILATIPVPLYAIPGNHDVGGFIGEEPTAERLAAWRSTWGPDTFCIDLGPWRLVGANVYRLGEPEHDAWLQAALATDHPIALFIHQPVCLVHPDQPDDGDWSLAPELRRPLLAAMDGQPVRLVASGHLHRYRAGTLPGGIATVWCPAASFLGTTRDDSRYVVGFVEHLLHDDGTVSHRLVRPDGVDDVGFEDFAPPDARGLRDVPLLPFSPTAG